MNEQKGANNVGAYKKGDKIRSLHATLTLLSDHMHYDHSSMVLLCLLRIGVIEKISGDFQQDIFFLNR